MRILRSPVTWLVAIVVGATALRLLWIDTPHFPYFDETDYVNAARTILGRPVPVHVWDTVLAGIDPNTEHPPLGKLVLAASMVLLGDGPLGWRLPSVLAGAVSLVAVYGIVRALGGAAWTGVLAVALVALDVLTFVHARLGALDTFLVALVLVGAWLALTRRWALSGITLAAAALVKASGVFGVVAVAGWLAWSAWRTGGRAGLRGAARPALVLGGTFSIAAVAGLWLLDLRFTEFTNPLDHLALIVGFGAGYHPGADQGLLPAAFGSPPWAWLLGGGRADYVDHGRAISLLGGPAAAAAPPVTVSALVNPVLLATLLAVVVLAGSRVRDRGRDADPELWSLLWIAATFLPWVAIAVLTSRWTFVHYMLPVVPGIAIATAAILARSPRLVTWAYLAACLVGFVAFYPYRGIP